MSSAARHLYAIRRNVLTLCRCEPSLVRYKENVFRITDNPSSRPTRVPAEVAHVHIHRARAAAVRPCKHPVDQVLPVRKLAVYGIQHVLAFYAGAVIVPILLAERDRARPASS